MALDPLLLIILIIAAVFFVTFLLTYFTLSFFTREKETDYSPSSPKKVTKKVRSILERNLVDELFKTIPVNLLDPSSLVELQQKLNNGLMRLKKTNSDPQILLETLRELRNEIEQWVVQQGAENFDISKQVYDFFFEWYNEVERELY